MTLHTLLAQMNQYYAFENEYADGVNDESIISQFYDEKIYILRFLIEEGVIEGDCCGIYFTEESLVRGNQRRSR